MIQVINIGNTVDDGTGDYLRKGGQKTNENFKEIYHELGDDKILHSAGAWKTYTAKSGALTPQFGQSLALNTLEGPINVTLPKGSVEDYNKVIRIRDVWNSWEKSPVNIIASKGDTIKGSSGSKKFDKNLMDLELVYCAPGRWEYVENKRVDRLTNPNMSTVIKRSIIAKQGQKDFLDIFNGNLYNTRNFDVYRRGNILYYGDNSFDKANADYGSPDGASNIKALDGKNVRLKDACEAGDVITFISFLDGIDSWKSSYNRKTVTLVDKTLSSETTIPGRLISVDFTKWPLEISMNDFGFFDGESANPYALEVLVNGVQYTQLNDANTQSMSGDYEFKMTNGKIEAIIFHSRLNHNDNIVLRWFNNDIGTTLPIEEITSITDQMYVASETLKVSNRIAYTDTDNPSQKTKIKVDDDGDYKVNNVSKIFDLFYPIGTIYENAHNAANPATYMGIGTWVRYAEGMTTVGWNSDSNDKNFHYNNSDLNAQGVPSKTAGGKVGKAFVALEKANLPGTETNEDVLIKDKNGTIIIGGCQFDPDDEGPGYDKYREDKATTGAKSDFGREFSLIQPSITTYKWIRVA